MTPQEFLLKNNLEIPDEIKDSVEEAMDYYALLKQKELFDDDAFVMTFQGFDKMMSIKEELEKYETSSGDSRH